MRREGDKTRMRDSMRARIRVAMVACLLLVSCGGGSGSSGGVPPIDPPPPPPPPPPPTEVALHSRLINFGSGFQGVAVDHKRSLIYASMRERNELLIIDADTYLAVDRF